MLGASFSSCFPLKFGRGQKPTTSHQVNTQMANQKQKGGSLKKVSESEIFVSEPPPHMFGNSPNENGSPYWNNKNWLKSRFHFSFAEYQNPQRTNFGALRVMNDDLVQPSRGFGTHGHRDAEIVTYIINGNLTHQDSMAASKETLGRGSVQFMTAGSGVRHSEHNLDPEHPLRFIQMWFTPRSRGLPPNYGSLDGASVDMKNKWAHLVGDVNNQEAIPIKLNQDVNIFVVEYDQGQNMSFELKTGRIAYLLCMEGSTQVSGGNDETNLKQHEAAHIFGPNNVRLTSLEAASHCLFVEMAS